MEEKQEKGPPANYGGATPEEIALAVLRYRPGKKNKPRPRPKRDRSREVQGERQGR